MTVFRKASAIFNPLSCHPGDLTKLTLASGEPVPTLRDFCETVAGRVPIVCEIKSRFDGDMRLAERVATLVSDYAGPICLESFDPRVMAHLRHHLQ